MPTDDLDSEGWVRTDDAVETIFSLPGVAVKSATVRYEDERTRQALAEATGHDIVPRFFAGTRLVFDPSLPPGGSPHAIAPLLRQEARSAFQERLRERGLIDIERHSSQRVRVGGGRRTRVTMFEAALPLSSERALPLACWLAPWTTSEDAIVVTGGHPRVSLAEFFDLETCEKPLSRSGESCREEFFSLVRGVE